MERFYNIAGPCNPARHYMLSAMARLAVFDPDLGGDWDAKLSRGHQLGRQDRASVPMLAQLRQVRNRKNGCEMKLCDRNRRLRRGRSPVFTVEGSRESYEEYLKQDQNAIFAYDPVAARARFEACRAAKAKQETATKMRADAAKLPSVEQELRAAKLRITEHDARFTCIKEILGYECHVW